MATAITAVMQETMALLSEKDARMVGARLSILANPVTLVLFTQEFEC